MDTPTTEPSNLTPAPVTPKAKSSVGTLITLLIIVAIIVIGAFYTWGERVAEDRQVPPTELPE
ncbi:MAG: hypothetical protein KBD05_02610 [Candidatus Pacebacteria bacterium]|nr:hypothetical protein [Candidatus Paceibacterota bacterium]